MYRWEAPLFFANAGAFRAADPRASSASSSRAGSCCSARRSPTSTSPPPRCSSSSTSELNEQGVHLAFVELRDRLQDLLLRYGLFETLDRDHFYPSMDEALAAIALEDETRTEAATEPERDGKDER